MTSAETHQWTALGVHVVYADLSYDIDRMRGYFSTFAAAWHACARIVHFLNYGEDVASVIIGRQRNTDQGPPRHTDEPLITTQSPRLRVHRLSIHSPMEITFAVEGGTAIIALYTTRLFARVLRRPENIGAWLSRLVAGWHQGMREAESQRAKRHRKPIRPAQPSPQMRELIKASDCLLELNMNAQEVTTIGTDELPDDLTVHDRRFIYG